MKTFAFQHTSLSIVELLKATQGNILIFFNTGYSIGNGNYHREVIPMRAVHLSQKTGDIYALAASALDDDPKIRPTAHIHSTSKPDWYELVDDLKKFEGDYSAEG